MNPAAALKGLFVGSGSDGLNEAAVSGAIIALTNKPAHSIKVLYVGTATYDLPGPRQRYLSH
jgi:hypothetical protein